MAISRSMSSLINRMREARVSNTLSNAEIVTSISLGGQVSQTARATTNYKDNQREWKELGIHRCHLHQELSPTGISNHWSLAFARHTPETGTHLLQPSVGRLCRSLLWWLELRALSQHSGKHIRVNHLLAWIWIVCQRKNVLEPWFAVCSDQMR